VPEFNCIVVRAPGVPAKYPTFPKINVKNVSIGQFLEFIGKSFDGVDIREVEGANDELRPLYTIRVNPERLTPETPPTGVMVYRLTDVINFTGSQQARRRRQSQGSDQRRDVAHSGGTDAAGDGEWTANIHAPTQTLVFKGTPKQIGVVEDVLKTLEPKPTARNDMIEAHLSFQLQQMRATLKVSRMPCRRAPRRMRPSRRSLNRPRRRRPNRRNERA